MRLLPCRKRFGAAMLVANAAVPLVRKTGAYREHHRLGVDGEREIALHLMLHTLTKNGTPFDPIIAVEGYEEFERAHERGTGVLVIGPHAALTLLMIRHFYDLGLDPVVITPDPSMRVGGTLVTARTVQPSPTFLVRTRSSLRRGDLVCAMPDRAEHHGDRTLEFDTAGGRVIVAPALMHLAARCGAQVVFTEVHVEGDRLAATFEAPSPNSAGSGEAITKDFIEFVRARVAGRSARRN